MLATWPYLWESPFRFLQVFQFMSDNPTVLPVLFGDQIYRAYDLPRRYLPFFLFFTLTEARMAGIFVWIGCSLSKVKERLPQIDPGPARFSPGL